MGPCSAPQKGGIITAMHRDFESLHVNVYALLRDLGVSADHTQFFYTAYAVALVADQPLRGLFFAPLVLQPAAQLYCVSISAVRSAVRRTAEEASRGGTLLFADLFPRVADLSAIRFVIRLAAYINSLPSA